MIPLFLALYPNGVIYFLHNDFPVKKSGILPLFKNSACDISRVPISYPKKRQVQ